LCAAYARSVCDSYSCMFLSTIIITFAGAKELRCECKNTKLLETQCPCGQVVHIRSALVGCPQTRKMCTKRIITDYPAVVKCNGASNCSIEKVIAKELCDERHRKDFISIIYDCVNSGKRKHFYGLSFQNSFYSSVISLSLLLDVRRASYTVALFQ